MNVTKTNNIKFEAGNIYLKRIHSDNIPSYSAIKKIAEEKDVDIFISKNKETKFLPKEDMYLIIASKQYPIVKRMFFKTGDITRHGASCTIINKQSPKEELGVRIYNSAINAIESLEKKIGVKR